MEGTTISGPHLGRARECEPILRALPDWFGIESALLDYVRDIERMPTFLAVCGDRIAGFVTVNRHFDGAGEIHVIAVRPEDHRSGVGRRLIAAAEAWLADDGVRFLQVKTLGPSRPDRNYDRTRRFYAAMGFAPLEEMKTLWGEANPCLVMIKSIGDAPRTPR